MTSTQQYADRLRTLDEAGLRARCLECARAYLRAPAYEKVREWHYCAICREECRRRGNEGVWDETYAQAVRERAEARRT